VGLLSVRFARVWVGIGQGTIVDCGACLARFRLIEVGYSVGKILDQKNKGPRLFT
jgi:hypothetical protein